MRFLADLVAILGIIYGNKNAYVATRSQKGDKLFYDNVNLQHHNAVRPYRRSEEGYMDVGDKWMLTDH